MRVSSFLMALFPLLKRFGEPLYAMRGLDGWKRKWRAHGRDEQPELSFIAVRDSLPLREVAAALELMIL